MTSNNGYTQEMIKEMLGTAWLDKSNIPEIQMEMFPPPPPKKVEVGTDAPHHNILERYYGEDWKPTPVEGLEDHY